MYFDFPPCPMKWPVYKEVVAWLPGGSHEFSCEAEIYQGEYLNVTVRWNAYFRTYWGGGSASKAGWSPSIIAVDADRDTGVFTATSTITVPAIKGGKLVLSSSDPIMVDFGAGPSSEASEITTYFTESGTATGAVKFMGRVEEPGKRVYNIRAESIYE